MPKKVRALKKQMDPEEKLARAIMDKYRTEISIAACTANPHPFSTGWKKYALGFPKAKRLKIGERIAAALQRIRTDWTLVLFVFHEDNGEHFFETEEVVFDNTDARFLDGHGTELLMRMFEQAEESTKVSTGWYAVPSKDFVVDAARLDMFYNLWEANNAWGVRIGDVLPQVANG